jgi:hypothetical protein
MADEQNKDKTNDNSDDKNESGANNLESMFAAMEARIMAGVNQAVTGMGNKLKKTTEAKFAELETKFAGSDGGNDDSIEDDTTKETKLAKQAEKTTDSKAGSDNAVATEMAAMRKQLADVQRNSDTQVQQLKAQLEAAKLAESAALTRANLVNQLSGKVTDADALLTLLEATGGVKYANGQFVTEVDDYGETKLVPITEPIKTGGKSFLETQIEGKYNYFQKARPGTGLGSEKGSDNSKASNGVNAISSDNYDPLAAAKLAEQGTDALFAALSATAQN